MLALRPERGRVVSGNEAATGVPVLEAFPLLLRALVVIDGGRGRELVDSSRFKLPRSDERPLLLVLVSLLPASSLLPFLLSTFFGALVGSTVGL